MYRREDKIIKTINERLVDIVFNYVRLDGSNVTKEEVLEVVLGSGDHFNPKHREIDNVIDGINFVINNFRAMIDADFICALNYELTKNKGTQCGLFRDGEIYTNDFDLNRDLPEYSELNMNFRFLLNGHDIVEITSEVFCYLINSDLFLDGNKKTALMVVSRILLGSGVGFILIKEPETLNAAISLYKETKDSSIIKSILADCIETV